MATDKKIPANIDEYIVNFPADIQKIMTELRETIRKAAPEATEKTSWGMPTFYLKGNLIHFAAHKKHIGLYPGAEAIQVFTKDLETYKTSKGAIQFPFDKPLPLKLITNIVKFNIERNLK
ncbi:iron chaperone [Dysgonomonas sp.]